MFPSSRRTFEEYIPIATFNVSSETLARCGIIYRLVVLFLRFRSPALTQHQHTLTVIFYCSPELSACMMVSYRKLIANT